MIRLHPHCRYCGALHPAVHVLTLGWQVVRCLECKTPLQIDVSPDAVLGSIPKGAPRRIA